MSTAEETIERLRQKADEEKEATDDAPEDEETEKVSSIREYIVLSQAGGKNWTEVERIFAGTQDAAIKSLGEALKNEATYVAVPARSWNPVTVAIETKTTLTLK